MGNKHGLVFLEQTVKGIFRVLLSAVVIVFLFSVILFSVLWTTPLQRLVPDWLLEFNSVYFIQYWCFWFYILLHYHFPVNKSADEDFPVLNNEKASQAGFNSYIFIETAAAAGSWKHPPHFERHEHLQSEIVLFVFRISRVAEKRTVGSENKIINSACNACIFYLINNAVLIAARLIL